MVSAMIQVSYENLKNFILKPIIMPKNKITTHLIGWTLKLSWETKRDISSQYQYNIKQTSDGNTEKYWLGDY